MIFNLRRLKIFIITDIQIIIDHQVVEDFYLQIIYGSLLTHNEKIMMITGNNFHKPESKAEFINNCLKQPNQNRILQNHYKILVCDLNIIFFYFKYKMLV